HTRSDRDWSSDVCSSDLPLPSETAGLAGRPEADNLVGIYAALSESSREQVLREFGGGQFSTFKSALADLAVAKLGPIGAKMTQRSEERRVGKECRAGQSA